MKNIKLDPQDDATIHFHLPGWMVRLWARFRFWRAVQVCKLGRHDYEGVSVSGGYVLLECFYCLRQKVSRLRLPARPRGE